MQEIIFSAFAEELDPYKLILEDFQKLHPGFHVRTDTMTWEDAWSKLFNVTVRGEGPAVSEIGSNWSNALVSMGALRPFTPSEINALGGDDIFFPSAWKSAHLSDNSTIWSIPWKINTYAVSYRRDLLAKAGIDEQTAFLTPESFATTIQQLHDSGVKTPFLMAGDYFYISLLHTIASWVWAMGGDYISADEHYVLFNKPEARAGIKAWFKLYDQIAAPYRSLTADDVVTKFKEGETAIFIGDFAYGLIMTEHDKQRVGIAAMPGIPFMGGTHLVVWKHAKYQAGGDALAVALASHLAGLNMQTKNYADFETVGSLPPRKDVLSLVNYPNETIKAAAERTLQIGRPHHQARLWTRIENQLGRTLADISKTVLAHPEQNLDAIMDSYLAPLERRYEVLLDNQ